jgi:hypothetical protein
MDEELVPHNTSYEGVKPGSYMCGLCSQEGITVIMRSGPAMARHDAEVHPDRFTGDIDVYNVPET